MCCAHAACGIGGAMPNLGLCRIEYEASAFGVELALSWRTKTIKPIRHSREGVIGLSGRPTGHRQADSDLLLR